MYKNTKDYVRLDDNKNSNTNGALETLCKKIVNGKLYATGTATVIGTTNYSYSSDLKWWDESLYWTSKGSWFTLGSGGPASKYARNGGSNEASGQNNVFNAISAEEALDWYTDNDVDAEIITKWFDIEAA